MRNTRPRTFKEVVATQDPTEMARLERCDHFVDPSVNAFHGEVSVNEDRYGTGEWRVEYFDDDGGCYVTIFAGPAAERRARDYFISLKSGRLRWVRADSTFWGDDLIISCTACRVMRLSSPATHRAIAHLRRSPR